MVALSPNSPNGEYYTCFEISVEMDGPFLLIVAAMLTLSRGIQPCTHANSTLCSMRYWLAPVVTGPFLACSAFYWSVPGLLRLLLACSWLVPLVTDLFLACSACYWLVPLVPCFSNVALSSAVHPF